MAVERMVPDGITEQTNLTGALSAIQDDPDSPDGNWLTAPSIIVSAAKTLYMVSAKPAYTEAHELREGGAAPTDAYFSGETGWETGNISNANRYSEMRPNVHRAEESFSTTVRPNVFDDENAFITPTAYTGSFAAGNWVISAILRSLASAQPSGWSTALRWRVYAATNTTGTTGLRELTSETLQSNAAAGVGSTTENQLARIATWAAPAITLNAEYIFFVCAVRTITAAGSGGARDHVFRENTNSKITTPVFTAVETEPPIRVQTTFPTPSFDLSEDTGAQEFRALVRKKGSGPSVPTHIQLWEDGVVAEVGADVNVSNTTGQIISHNWDATGLNPATIECRVIVADADRQVGSTVEVGAIEWNAASAVVALIRSANSFIASTTSRAARAAVSKLRTASTNTASMTGRTARAALAKARSLSSHTAVISSGVSRLAIAKARASAGNVKALSTHAIRRITSTRAANSYVAALSALSKLTWDVLRTANSSIDVVTGLSNRLSNAFSRSIVSHVNAISARTNSAREALMSALSHVGAITGRSNRLTQFIRNLSSYITQITSESHVGFVLTRMVISHVRGLSAVGHRIVRSTRHINTFMAALTSYSSLQQLIVLTRNALAYVENITGTSDRDPIDRVRSMLMGVADFGARSSRVTTFFKTSGSYISAITGYNYLSRGVLRSASTVVDAITSLVNRVTTLFRTQYSTGEVSSSSSVSSISVRTAIAHVTSITGIARNTTIPKLSPGSMVIVTKPSVQTMINTYNKNTCVVGLRKKTHATVELNTK